MGLSTDSVFISALQSNDTLMALIGQTDDKPARLYGIAIPLPDEELDNVPQPYIVVTFDGLQNQQGTKDDTYESIDDMVDIGILVCAKTLKQLHKLTKMVRSTVLSYLRNTQTCVEDYTLTADAIQFDQYAPSYWQVLRYQCEVYNNDDNNEQDEE